MLDAEGYPRAFLVHHGYRYEFSRPSRRSGRLEARVVITPDQPDEGDRK
jgi:methionyl-tRNA formyltransferase